MNTLYYEIVGFEFLHLSLYSSLGISQAALWGPLVIFPLDSENDNLIRKNMEWYIKWVKPVISGLVQPNLDILVTGRLSWVVEGGGKRRVFAIGNYVNQRLLRPFHDWLMRILRFLPTDGTFNQSAPFDRLINKQTYYSFDLSSATDYFPFKVQFTVVESLFGREFASVTTKFGLRANLFDVPGSKYPIGYQTGQQMGYYSSWPLFALSHHVLIWWIALQVYPERRFQDYAVLGDDVVIADRKVAEAYRNTITKLGVKISEQKSLISNRGCAEFAKKFKVKGLTKDLSPLSVRSLLTSHHPYGAMRIPVPRVSTLCRLVGMGFKSLSRINHSDSKVIRMLRSVGLKATLPFDLWVSEGKPIDPGVYGQVHEYLRKKFAPKDLILPPQELVLEGEDGYDLLEYTLFQRWMAQWLEYQKWYSLQWAASFRGAKLEDWFKGPVVNNRWYRESKDPEASESFGNSLMG
jgi:hypothetical protein